ncbi:MAG: glucosaminidase domain-containing protein [Alistipes sp.]|nr:glucosaminidase domain-containing protein [Alistipes sp.]
MKLNLDSVLRVALLAMAVTMIDQPVSAQVAEPDKDKALSPTDEWVKLTPEEYIYRWRETAIDNMEVYGIPASITLGQAVLESGFGNGYLARVANNHFCIKCKSTWTGKTITHADDRPDDCFRVYDTAEESFEDHADFLSTGNRYEFLFAYDIDDYKSWAKGLKKAGYATASDYADRLIGVIERYHLYLFDRKDGLKLYDEYLANDLTLDPAALTPTAPASQPTESVADGYVAIPNMPRDVTIAYADRGIDPNNFRVSINSHFGYNVFRTNGAHYIITKKGDTYEHIGDLFEVSPATLRKFNDVDGRTQPEDGDVLYIERKAARWNGEGMFHKVTEGETLHLISQIYGIRLTQLSKLNTIRPTATLSTGQNIRLR